MGQYRVYKQPGVSLDAVIACLSTCAMFLLLGTLIKSCSHRLRRKGKAKSTINTEFSATPSKQPREELDIEVQTDILLGHSLSVKTCLLDAAKDDNEYNRVVRLMEKGSFEDAKMFLNLLAKRDAEALKYRRFGRRQQHLLHVVAEVGSVQLLEYFLARLRVTLSEKSNLSKGVDELLEPRDIEGCTPLVYAVCRGRLDLVEALLKFGANVADVDFHGNTILMHSATSRDIDVVSTILRALDDKNVKELVINEQNCECSCTAVHFAAVENSCEIIELLIKHGADPHMQKAKGFTALHAAARFGRIKIFRQFVEEDASTMQVR